MMNIILDTNIIMRWPKVLGLKAESIHMLIPLDVIDELNYRANQRGASTDKRLDLIEQAIQEGIVSIINTDQPLYKSYLKFFGSSTLSRVDASIIAVAYALQNKNENVKIATLDKEIQLVARNNNIEVLHEDELKELLLEFATPLSSAIDSLQNLIVKYEKKERDSFWISITSGLGIALSSKFLFGYLDYVYAYINVWGTIILILIAGVALFYIREKVRLTYGVFEFFVGVFVIILLFQPEKFDYSKLEFSMDFNVKLLGGLYIMVRGQDNIVKGLKDRKLGIILKDKFGIGT